MKTKALLIAVFITANSCLFSQNEFKKVWETKVDVENKWNSCNGDLSMVLIGDLKAFSMVDGTTGKTLWTFNAKEKVGVKSVEDWTFLWAKEGEPVEVIYNKPKEDTKTTIYLNPKTGEQLSSFTESSLKDKTVQVKRKKSRTKYAISAYDEQSTTFVDLFFKDKFLKNSCAGNTFDVTVKAEGGNTWSTSIKAKAVTHINRLLLSDNEPAIMMNVIVKYNKVFVLYEGMTVLDLKTGNVLWATTFDMVDAGMTSQEIGKMPLPTIDKDAVYICDLSKDEKTIKKLDINTGAVLWKGEKLSKNDVISQLSIVNNVLIAKYGGIIRKAKSVYNANSGATTNIAKNIYEGTTDVKAYDANSGALIWSAEKIFVDDKISKSECEILIQNDEVIVCTAKNIYYVDYKTGAIKHKTELGKEIGKPQYIFDYNNNVIVSGDEGIASFSSNGSKNYAVSTNKNLLNEFRGDAFLIWVGKSDDDMNEFIRFDLSTGKTLGKLKGCYVPRFDQTGDYFIRFNNETITKHQTN